MKKLKLFINRTIVTSFLAIIVFAATMPFVEGCQTLSNSSDEKQQEQTEKIMKEINKELGMPNITNFQQKRLMKMIYEQADREDLICYVYLQAEMTGKLIYIGKSVGYGVPFSAQYTNPEKIVKYTSGSKVVIPQADPNGLYMPTSSSATWLLMIDPKTNKPRLVYIEPEIVVSPFKLNLN